VTSNIEIVVAKDPAQEVAERLAAAARTGGHVVLTGGSTPRIAYGLAAELETDWTAVELWWGDERCVAPDDERSNYGMAKQALLDHVAVAAVHRMRGELGRDAGAAQYEQELGDLDKVKGIIKVLGMVNASPSFGDHPKVINGCSDLMVEVFGDAGRHARSAVGMGSLPGQIPVEIELIALVE